MKKEKKRMTNEFAIAVLKCLIGYYNNEDQDSYVGFDNEDNEAIDMAINALEQTRWIPVYERLPEKTDCYLIQYSREVCPNEMAVAFYSVEEAEVDSNYTWEFKPIADCKEVIAWMPLPEPYKAESEDDEYLIWSVEIHFLK